MKKVLKISIKRDSVEEECYINRRKRERERERERLI